MSRTADAQPPLNAGQAAELAAYVAELARLGLPMTEALRAHGRDLGSPELQAAVDRLIDRLEAGQSPPDALKSIAPQLPAELGEVLVAAAESGHVERSLDALLVHERAVDDMTWQFWRALAYPLLLLTLLAGWLLLIGLVVAPELSTALGEELAEMSRTPLDSEPKSEYHLIGEFSSTIGPLLLSAVVTVAALVLLTLAVGGRAGISRVSAALPIVGPSWLVRGQFDFAGLLATFVEQRLPLGDAVRLAGAAARDPALRSAVPTLARDVNAGLPLSAALDRQSVFSPSLVAWVRIGESRHCLADALRSAGAVFARRFDLNIQGMALLASVAAFSLVVASVLFVLAVVVQPLLSLISYLSWYGAPTIGPTVPARLGGTLSVFVLGFSLLLATRLTAVPRKDHVPIAGIIWFVGWILLATGFLAACFQVASILAFPIWMITIIAWIRGARYARMVQRRGLWAALSLAADRKAPLAPVALAAAEERADGFSVLARRLADRLASGTPLVKAMSQGRRALRALPPEAQLAAQVGELTGDLPGAMRATADIRPRSSLLPGPLVWVFVLMFVALSIAVFLKIRIAPAMIMIARDFDSELPEMTRVVDGTLDSLVVFWPLVWLSVVALLFVWLQWIGLIRPFLPGLSRVVRWLEMQRVLRVLALTVRHQRSLADALHVTGEYDPRYWLRGDLRRTARDVGAGMAWQDALRRRKLLSRDDAALLHAAERNGNLAWALDHLAESFQARAAMRLKAWADVALPLVVTLGGMLVALFVIAYFLPVAHYINMLS